MTGVPEEANDEASRKMLMNQNNPASLSVLANNEFDIRILTLSVQF